MAGSSMGGVRLKRTRKYTRRKIPPGFAIALPRQACPQCSTLLDVRITEGGTIYFLNTGETRGGSKGGSSEPEDDPPRKPIERKGSGP